MYYPLHLFYSDGVYSQLGGTSGGGAEKARGCPRELELPPRALNIKEVNSVTIETINHTFIFWGPFCWNLSWANGVRCINISPIQNPAQICRHIGGLHPQLYRYPWKRCGPR